MPAWVTHTPPTTPARTLRGNRVMRYGLVLPAREGDAEAAEDLATGVQRVRLQLGVHKVPRADCGRSHRRLTQRRRCWSDLC